ncbi:MAG: hypothetical protein IJM51_00800 [Clostridia bacterium]|nr:hypothetical protein [Clostridia bacterium]
MASSNNNNNQPRRKRNKKPVKRYSEEYNNRPNPYTGYSADGNYHPEAKKRSVKDASSARARAAEEERIAAMNAAMAEAAWGPAAGRQPQPVPPPVQGIPYQAVVPPTVMMPAPKWAVSNNLTRQQMAAQEPPQSAPEENETAPSGGESGSPVQEPPKSPKNAGSHRKKNHRGKDESARERAVKTEAKRAAVDKIAKGVAAHSVSEQMIEDISSMSDVIESLPKAQKASTETGVNWEEFYDAAFPSKAQESTKPHGKKTAKPKKRVEFADESAADEPMTVKPVMLGDDDLLPYDKIAKENEREAAEARAAEEKKAAGEEEKAAPPVQDTVPDTNAAELAAEFRREEKPAGIAPEDLPPLEELSVDAAPLDSAEDMLSDISAAVTSVSIEEILASVENRNRDSAHIAEAVTAGAEIGMDTIFSSEAGSDSDWNEVIPARGGEEEREEQEENTLLSDRLLQSFNQTENPDGEEGYAEPELEGIETVDLNQFLHKDEPREEAEVPPEPEPPAEEFVHEIIFDTAQSEKQAPEQAEEPPLMTAEEPEQVVEVIPEAPASAQTPEQPQPETQAEESALPVFVEEAAAPSEVEVIISDLEDEIFAEETVSAPPGEAEGEEADTGIDVEDKIEKLAEAAEVAELFRQESEDVLPGSELQKDESGVFSVSIDDISVTPEVRTSDEEVREYKPREKTREPDENLFESVLIVDENPAIVDKTASAGQDETLFLHTREQSENPTAVFKLPEGPIVFPTDIDDAEFQEQWLDEEEDGDDMASRNKRTRRRISAFIGAVALLFAVMILFSAVKTVVSGFTNIGSISEKKTEYTEFISPVVVNDPLPFETIEKADNNMLLKSSIWEALRGLDETEGYEHVSDATNKIVLPADLVEKAAKKLFGSDVKLNMNVLSEYDGSAIYYYDSIDNSFHITRSGITGPSAVITKIAQKSDYISLVVGYVNQDEMTLTSSEGSEEECYKFMEYVLAVKSNGSYYIKSIRNYVDD